MIRNAIIAFVVLVIFLLLIYPFTYASAQEHRHPGKVFTGDVGLFSGARFVGALPIRLAASQASSHVALNPNIVVGHWMTAQAGCHPTPERTPSNVFLEGNGLQMLRIDAGSILTKMVDCKPGWDRSSKTLIRIAMSVPDLSGRLESTVSRRQLGSYPYPTRVRFLDLSKEPLVKNIHTGIMPNNAAIIKIQGHAHSDKIITGEVGRFYGTWMRPDDRSQSCCNFHDCDATEARIENGRWRAYSRVQSKWIDIPATRIEREREVPPGAHLCENTSGVICFGAGGGT